jgi:hypothetical protein
VNKQWISDLIDRIIWRVQYSIAEKRTFHELEKIAQRESAELINEHLGSAVLFTDLRKFWDRAIGSIPESGLLLEFGVFEGTSTNYFARKLTEANDQRTYHGFDSFEGLSDDWVGTQFAKASYNTFGKQPKVPDNVTLVEGLVEATLPEFYAGLSEQPPKIAFMHMDLDTYPPTKFVLDQSVGFLQEGTVIVFDELLGSPGWKQNEYRALIESLPQHCEYEFIGFCEERQRSIVGRFIRAAIRVVRVF